MKQFLNQEHFPYKIYQEPTTNKEVDIFANYGEVIKNKERQEELNTWDNVDSGEKLNNDDEWWK